ncbi:hypothetical protein TNCT_637351 [Trichonephila clavata]|uniref:Uncharacterized protein n=1 Tax=Trichonephila clavata TaxID=2740835 RepID=A0A8X6IXW4_TRICU|nr:hypothetical protein TNCT_637351 [Trichonephila clavata]
MFELLAYPVPLCMHNFKYKSVKKRAPEPIIRPGKLTANVSKNTKKDVTDFKIPRKTAKNSTVSAENAKIIATKNSFAVLNTANKDAKERETSPQLHLKSLRL